MKAETLSAAPALRSPLIWLLLSLALGLVMWLIAESIGLILELGYQNELHFALIIGAAVAVAIAPWLEFLWRTPGTSSKRKLRFSIRTLLWTTAIMAAFFAGLHVSDNISTQRKHRRTQEQLIRLQMHVDSLETQLTQVQMEKAAESTARLQVEQELDSLLDLEHPDTK